MLDTDTKLTPVETAVLGKLAREVDRLRLTRALATLVFAIEQAGLTAEIDRILATTAYSDAVFCLREENGPYLMGRGGHRA